MTRSGLYAYRGLGMTILGFAIGTSHVLLAADTAALNVVETPPAPGMVDASKFRFHKIREVVPGELAWALTGDVADIGRFGQWMATAPRDDWGAFAVAAGGEMSGLNQDALRRGHVAKTKRHLIQQSAVIVAGRMGSRREVLIISEDGNTHFPSESGMKAGFIGAYSPTVSVAWNVASAFAPTATLDDADTMRCFLDAVCEGVLVLGGPVDVWVSNHQEVSLD